MADDERFMDQALAGARSAIAHGDVPIGALVVHDGIVVGTGHNARERDQDPTAHAELIALRESARTLGRWRLSDCALYVTLEPCAMCAGAGLGLALCCDVRVAAESASFRAAWSKVGLVPDAASAYFLPRLVGWG
ncbi:MAG TPA: deaminase, partial [Candidatus Limnocylindria bacterium]